jgi:hypothetical protein
MNYEEIKQRKVREIRRQIIGMGILKCAAQGEDDVHIHYLNENGLPPAAMQTPMMHPQEKFTMDRDEFKAQMLKKYAEQLG